MGIVALTQQGGQGIIEDLAEGVVVIAGGPFAQLVELCRQDRAVVQHPLDGFEFGVIAVAVTVDQAHQGATTERDLHPAAARRRGVARVQVVKAAC